MELLGEGSVEFMLRVFDFKCMTVYALQIKRSFFFYRWSLYRDTFGLK